MALFQCALATLRVISRLGSRAVFSSLALKWSYFHLFTERLYPLKANELVMDLSENGKDKYL